MKNIRKKILFTLGVCVMIVVTSFGVTLFVRKNELSSNSEKLASGNQILEKIVYLNPEKTISIKIPDSWEYETISDVMDDVLNEVHLYPDFNKKNVYMSFRKDKKPLGVCGTFLTTEKLSLNNGKEATVGYYDGGTNWSFINIASENLFSWNSGLTEEQSKIGIEIMKSISYE